MESHAQLKQQIVARDDEDEIKSVSLSLEVLYYLLRIVAEQSEFKDLIKLRLINHLVRDEIDYRIIPEMAKFATSAKMIDLLYQVPVALGIEFTKIYRDTGQYQALLKTANQLSKSITIQNIFDFGCLALCISSIYKLDYRVIGTLKDEATQKIDELLKTLRARQESQDACMHIMITVIEAHMFLGKVSCNRSIIKMIIEKIADTKNKSVHYIESLINKQPNQFKFPKKLKIELLNQQLAAVIFSVCCANKDIIDAIFIQDIEIKKLFATLSRLEYIRGVFELLYGIVAYNFQRQHGVPDANIISQLKGHNHRRLSYNVSGRYVNLSGLQLHDLIDFCNTPIYINYANLSYTNGYSLDLSLFKLRKSSFEYADLAFTFWRAHKEENTLAETIIRNSCLKQADLPVDEIELLTAQDFETPKILAKCLNEFCMMDKVQDPVKFRKSIRQQIIAYAMGFAINDIDLAIALVQQAEQHEFFLFSSKKIKNTALKLFDADKHKLPNLIVTKDRRALRKALKKLSARKEKQQQCFAKRG